MVMSFSTAITAFDFARQTISLRAALGVDPSLQDNDYELHALEFLNYKSSFMFRHLDHPFRPDDWSDPQLAFSDHTEINALLGSLKLLDDAQKEGVVLSSRKLVDRHRFYASVIALTVKNNAVFHEARIYHSYHTPDP